MERTTIEGLEWILEGDKFGFGENWTADSEPQSEEEMAGYYIQRAVDALKEREGKWERQYSRPGVYANLYWWCSCCKKPTSYHDAGIFYKYCPQCGAKLKKANDE